MLKRTAEGYLYQEFIYCGCNCGKTRSRVNSSGNIRTHLAGHGIKGKHHSEEHRKNLSEAQRGEKNHRWKGDNAGYEALHHWVRKHFWPTGLCQMCMLVPPRDLACITGIYNREFKNWRYYCRSCHKIFDINICLNRYN